MTRTALIVAFLVCLWSPLGQAQVATDTPTETPTDTPADTPTETPTDTPTTAASDTPTDTPGPLATDTPTETATETPTDTPGPAGTDTDTPTPTETPTDTPTTLVADTPTATPTAGPSRTPTDTPPPTVTFTPTVPPVKDSSVSTRSLVQAQCVALGVSAPCNNAGINFAKGKVRLNRVRQPDTASDTVMGRIKMSRVFPTQPRLEARVIADVSYGRDPDGDCPLAGTQVVDRLFAKSSMECMKRGGASNCKGDLLLPSLSAPQCTDVAVIAEHLRVEVYDIVAVGTTTSLIARDGLKIIGGR